MSSFIINLMARTQHLKEISGIKLGNMRCIDIATSTVREIEHDELLWKILHLFVFLPSGAHDPDGPTFIATAFQSVTTNHTPHPNNMPLNCRPSIGTTS